MRLVTHARLLKKDAVNYAKIPDMPGVDLDQYPRPDHAGLCSKHSDSGLPVCWGVGDGEIERGRTFPVIVL